MYGRQLNTDAGETTEYDCIWSKGRQLIMSKGRHLYIDDGETTEY